MRSVWRGLLLLALSLLYLPAHAQVRYTITDLGILPGGLASQAFAINEFGDITGVVYTDGQDVAFLYDRKGMHNLGPIGTYTSAFAINNFGQMAGTSVISVFDPVSGGTYGYSQAFNGNSNGFIR